MGYGLGGLLTALGLVLALAVQDRMDGVDLTMVGWILTGVGIVMLIGTFATLNGSRKKSATAMTTHADGSQTVKESEVRS